MHERHGLVVVSKGNACVGFYFHWNLVVRA